MTPVGQARATLADLSRVTEKAELVGGRILRYMPSGHKPSQVAFEIAVRLREYAKKTGKGVAYADNMGIAVPELSSGRESFSPDAAYYTGLLPVDPMRFVEGVTALAVEVRSQNDYGDAAEQEMADKRADYFAAGSAVVWDVDPIDEVIHVYRKTTPSQPVTYRRGQNAEAEPAVPGWLLPVEAIFA